MNFTLLNGYVSGRPNNLLDPFLYGIRIEEDVLYSKSKNHFVADYDVVAVTEHNAAHILHYAASSILARQIKSMSLPNRPHSWLQIFILPRTRSPCYAFVALPRFFPIL